MKVLVGGITIHKIHEETVGTTIHKAIQIIMLSMIDVHTILLLIEMVDSEIMKEILDIELMKEIFTCQLTIDIPSWETS